eukprot:TRINITY_DN61772_c0_g1_i1.p2 TRINITY_DN61772_c0_g1~~TRINITY_DN61772_c0_g1_i1.p2  ORF type:complete len:152 (+),score=14.82 TRINITY_DN61772_c0_g1_i1:217-672(+)
MAGATEKFGPLLLRFLECCFCSACFAIMTFLTFQYRSLNSTAYLFGIAICGLIVSFLLMCVHGACVAGVKMDALGVQLFGSFMMLLLVFAASCASATFTSNVCNEYSNNFLIGKLQDNCSLLKWANAMGFLASFTYIASFWLYTSIVYMEA